MRSMATKSSFGNGYGINRNLKSEQHLGVALPPHAGGITLKPGLNTSRPARGMSGKTHFQGAKIYKKNA